MLSKSCQEGGNVDNNGSNGGSRTARGWTQSLAPTLSQPGLPTGDGLSNVATAAPRTIAGKEVAGTKKDATNAAPKAGTVTVTGRAAVQVPRRTTSLARVTMKTTSASVVVKPGICGRIAPRPTIRSTSTPNAMLQSGSQTSSRHRMAERTTSTLNLRMAMA